MRVEVDGQHYEVPNDATTAEIDAISKPAAAAPGISATESGLRGAAQGLTFSLGPKIEGVLQAAGQKIPFTDAYSKKPFSQLREESTASAQRDYAKAQEANPGAYGTGELTGGILSSALVPGGAGVKGAMKAGALIGGLNAYGRSGTQGDDSGRSLAETALGTGLGTALGGAGYGVAKGLGAGIGWLGNKLLPRAQAFEASAAGAMADKASAAADATAKSARGSLGAATAEGSRTLERLGMDAGLPAAEQAANRVALSTPDAEALAVQLAGKARTKLPDQLAHIQGADALAQQTAQDAAQAKATGATVDYSKQALKARLGEQAKRYAIPLAAGAVGGLTGDDDGGFNWGRAGVAALAGRGVSPTARALMKTAAGPEVQRLAGAVFRSTAERMAAMASSSPGLVSRFPSLAVLQSEAAKGPEALSRAHYALSTNPEYQELQRVAAQKGDE